MSNDDRNGFAEVVRYYDLWRQISRYFGKTPGDEAIWQDGRLYFRTDYIEKATKWAEWEQYGDWAAYIIEPRAEGYYNVLSSLRHERASQRSEEVEAAFSQVLDAGKYILAHIGNYLRIDLRMSSLVWEWDSSGLDIRVDKSPASHEAIEYMVQVDPSTSRNVAEKYLSKYTLIDDSSCYAYALPSQEAYMRILVLSYRDLNASLIDGMPEDLTTKVAEWSGNLGID